MKIGIFDPYLATLGGGEKYLLTIAECLSKDHQVAIFWDDESIREKAKRRFLLDLSEVEFVRDIFSKRAGIVRRFRSSRQYDLIIYLSDGSIPMVFSKRLFIHFQFPTEWIGSLAPSDRIKLLRVNKIICNSTFTKKYIERKFEKECVVLYPPVDVTHSYTKVEKKNQIITVGRHTRPQGVDFKKHGFLIETFKKIAGTHKGWELIVITNSLPEHEKHIAQLRESAKGFPITIHNDIPREKILALYDTAKMYWHAAGYGEDIEQHPELAEHFGIVTVEAMNRGAVPIVFRAGGQSEIVSNGRSGYLWNTAEDFIEKTEFLMDHENDRKKLAKHAFEDSLRFDKKKFCQEISSML